MLPFKRALRYVTPILPGAVSMLATTLAMTAPLLAQKPEPQTLARCDQTKALSDYQKALQANPQSSLTNYCIAELLFNEHNWQSSAIAYRLALDGNGDPPWTVVWSHIQLGKIFDITDQRGRAEKEYRLALGTEDNTRGALDEVRQLLQKPYKLPQAQ